MKLKRIRCAALAVALLISMCSCGPVNIGGNGTGSGAVSGTGGTSAGQGTTVPPPSGAASSDTSGEPAPGPSMYDESHTLNIKIPPLIGGLEMPIAGATGYASVTLPLWLEIPSGDGSAWGVKSSRPSGGAVPLTARTLVEETETSAPEEGGGEAPAEEPAPTPAPYYDPYEGAIDVLAPGTAFRIIQESGDWWYVALGGAATGTFGWIEHRYCMINLPDVIPSIIYDDTNAYCSLFKSCGKDIPNVTGQAFYNSKAYNERLGEDQFMMPMLYSSARDVCAAQHKALAEGNCLVIYQTFRPYDTQRAVVNGLTALSRVDPEVRAGVATPPWSIAWFINTDLSNHQKGYALDVSMVKVYECELKYVGECPYLHMTDYEAYNMPTEMHELSTAAISTISPTSTELSDTMNDCALALRKYFTTSGFTPLASEWWHFNNVAAMRASAGNPSDGRYFITTCYSQLPSNSTPYL